MRMIRDGERQSWESSWNVEESLEKLFSVPTKDRGHHANRRGTTSAKFTDQKKKHSNFWPWKLSICSVGLVHMIANFALTLNIQTYQSDKRFIARKNILFNSYVQKYVYVFTCFCVDFFYTHHDIFQEISVAPHVRPQFFMVTPVAGFLSKHDEIIFRPGVETYS
jgi:hypothetical protein